MGGFNATFAQQNPSVSVAEMSKFKTPTKKKNTERVFLVKLKIRPTFYNEQIVLES